MQGTDYDIPLDAEDSSAKVLLVCMFESELLCNVIAVSQAGQLTSRIWSALSDIQ